MLRPTKVESPIALESGEVVEPAWFIWRIRNALSRPRVTAHRADDDVPLLDACRLGCTIPSGVGSALRAATAEPNPARPRSVGPVGNATIVGAKYRGWQNCVGIDLDPNARLLSASLLSVPVFAPEDCGQFTGSIDVIFETSGTPDGLELATHLVSPGGQIVLVGLQSEPLPIRVSDLVGRGISIHGSLMGGLDPQRDAGTYQKILKTCRTPLAGLLGKVLPWRTVTMPNPPPSKGRRTIMAFDSGGVDNIDSFNG